MQASKPRAESARWLGSQAYMHACSSKGTAVRVLCAALVLAPPGTTATASAGCRQGGSESKLGILVRNETGLWHSTKTISYQDLQYQVLFTAPVTTCMKWRRRRGGCARTRAAAHPTHVY